MSPNRKVNSKNLRQMCHVAGFNGISGLCKNLGISRNTAYLAVKFPNQFPKAFPKIIKALNAK